MKYLLLSILTTVCLKSDAQKYAQFAAGLSTTHSLTVNPSFSYSLYKFFLQAEMAALINNDQPVYFGMSAGYHFNINEHVSTEPSAGRYYEYFSGDAYDKYKNRWRYMVAVKLFYNNVFLQLQVSHISILSLGFKEEF